MNDRYLTGWLSGWCSIEQIRTTINYPQKLWWNIPKCMISISHYKISSNQLGSSGHETCGWIDTCPGSSPFTSHVSCTERIKTPQFSVGCCWMNSQTKHWFPASSPLSYKYVLPLLSVAMMYFGFTHIILLFRPTKWFHLSHHKTRFQVSSPHNVHRRLHPQGKRGICQNIGINKKKVETVLVLD